MLHKEWGGNYGGHEGTVFAESESNPGGWSASPEVIIKKNGTLKQDTVLGVI
jgi:hypothetical protein